jgi:tryptophan-rich sensory protein
VWREAGFGLALGVYAVQLVLNAAWSALFFGLRRPDLAFFNLIALWLSIAAMIALYAPIDATAAWMLAPYLAWVAFAGVLNYTIWQMNRMDVPADRA